MVVPTLTSAVWADTSSKSPSKYRLSTTSSMQTLPKLDRTACTYKEASVPHSAQTDSLKYRQNVHVVAGTYFGYNFVFPNPPVSPLPKTMLSNIINADLEPVTVPEEAVSSPKVLWRPPLHGLTADAANSNPTHPMLAGGVGFDGRITAEGDLMSAGAHSLCPYNELHRMLSNGPGGEGFDEAAAQVAEALGSPLWKVLHSITSYIAWLSACKKQLYSYVLEGSSPLAIDFCHEQRNFVFCWLTARLLVKRCIVDTR